MSYRLGGRSLAQRLADLSMPEPNSGCIIWLGQIACKYGHIGEGAPSRRMLLVHRAAYELANGAIPGGMTIDHLCRVTTCINPAHMELTTLRENLHRGVLARRPVETRGDRNVCKFGHALTGANLIPRETGRLGRCRACAAEAARRYELRQKNLRRES